MYINLFTWQYGNTYALLLTWFIVFYGCNGTDELNLTHHYLNKIIKKILIFSKSINLFTYI